MKAGFTEKNNGQPSCYASSSSHQEAFVPFHDSFCNQTCLPEFPFKDEMTGLEIDESLMNPESSNFSSTPFFPGSELSELQQLGESLSSSSMRSLSGGSPEYSIRFPSMGIIDDESAIARAMMAVMSTASCSSSPPPTAMNQIWTGCGEVGGSLEQYSGSMESMNGVMSQEMMMTMMSGDGKMHDGRPNANQLHHMISERRRREKLNDSFSALRTLLPPGTKKDKASVLASTIEQMSSLKAQISDLEAKNKTMELSVLPPADDENNDNGLRKEKEMIKMSWVSDPSSGMPIIELRVAVPANCDMMDLNLHVLECFRERPHLELLSLEGNIYVKPRNGVKMHLLTIRLKGGNEKDEGPFKEALARAIKEALA